MACTGNASFEDYGGSFPLYQGGEFFKFFYDARDLLPKPVQVQTRKQFKLRFNVFRIEALIRCSDAVEVKLLAGGQRSDIMDTSWAVLAFYEGVAALLLLMMMMLMMVLLLMMMMKAAILAQAQRDDAEHDYRDETCQFTRALNKKICNTQQT